MAGETPANLATLACREERSKNLAPVAQHENWAWTVVDDEAGGWSKRPGPDGWPAATSAPHRDQVRTLCFGQLAHDVAGLAVKLSRLDARGQPTRQALRLRKRLGSTFELSLGELMLTMRRQVVTTRPARRQVQGGPWPHSAHEHEQELGLPKPEQVLERIE